MYTGKLVRLREYRQEDVPLVQAYFNDSETRSLMDLRIGYPYTLADVEQAYQKNSADHDTYHFAVEAIDTGKFIGDCSVCRVEWKARVAMVGIFIGDKDYWGKGYGADAMEALTRFCFVQLNMNKVKLGVFSFNARARRCYEKCGFTVEGILRQEAYDHGQYHDMIAMGILRGEWEARHIDTLG